MSDPKAAVGRRRWGPIAVVASAVAFDCWTLRAERTTVAYPTDTSVHVAMVRFAAQRIAAGHLPWTSWFPYISMGSAQFLHYQSLPSVLTGLIAQLSSPVSAVAWTTFLLLGTWPLCVYLSGRLMSLSPWAAAGACAASPFLSSAFSSGYEQRAYIFLGYGLWTQLFAMWTLPIAWGFTWRAINENRNHLPAVFFVALTVACHFETGYLAILPVIVWPWVGSGDMPRRLRSAALVAAGSLVVSAWAWLPLFAQRKWSAVNSILAGTAYQNGYGIEKMLDWLFTGHIFDSGAVVPIISMLGGVGLVEGIVSWRREPAKRAIVAIAVCSLLLECGRSSFGPLSDLVPGHQDVYFRRFAVGLQLAWLLLAGTGLVTLARASSRLVLPSRLSEPSLRATAFEMFTRWALVVLVCATVASGLGAAVARVTKLDAQNSQAIARQASADRTQGSALDLLVSKMESLGPGRVYAGTTTNWGAHFTVGEVPVYKYLQTEGVDVMVYSAATTSLMLDPEFYFDERDAGDYALFGIRYLILPARQEPRIGARLVGTESAYSLWQVDGGGYARIGDTVGSLEEDRSDIWARSRSYVTGPLAERDQYLTVGFGGSPAPPPTDPGADARGIAGSITSETYDLGSGSVRLGVSARRRAVVVLSVTYDPGWRASVDGHPAPTEMVAPALLAVVVGPGTHQVEFAYVGYRYYGPLFVVSAGVLVVWLALVIAASQRRRRRPTGDRPTEGRTEEEGDPLGDDALPVLRM